jgi:nucleotide-binding universal stress UspA family protein
MSTVFKNILLASHGTAGALAAENQALALCAKGGKIHHLFVVPSLWQGMTGDDWLNNGTTRDHFRRYLEHALGNEVDNYCERVSNNTARHKLQYSKEILLGEPSSALVDASSKKRFDLIVMGSRRPSGEKGLRSRMLTKDLVHCIQLPLLIVPHPSFILDVQSA